MERFDEISQLIQYIRRNVDQVFIASELAAYKMIVDNYIDILELQNVALLIDYRKRHLGFISNSGFIKIGELTLID